MKRKILTIASDFLVQIQTKKTFYRFQIFRYKQKNEWRMRNIHARDKIDGNKNITAIYFLVHIFYNSPGRKTNFDRKKGNIQPMSSFDAEMAP